MENNSIISEFIINKLYTRAYMFTRCKHNSNDAVQEVAYYFFRNKEYLKRPIEEQKAIATTILKNVLIKFFRINTTLKKNIDIANNNNTSWLHGNSSSFDIESRVDYRNLLFFMKERKDKCIDMFWLFNIGFSIKEISTIYNKCNLASVKSYIRCGKQRMNKILKGYKGKRTRWSFPQEKSNIISSHIN